MQRNRVYEMIVLGALFIRHGISKRISIVDYCAIVHCRGLPTITSFLSSFLDDKERERRRRREKKESQRGIKEKRKGKLVEKERIFSTDVKELNVI